MAIDLDKDNVFCILNEEYKKNKADQDRIIINECFSFFEKIAWLDLTSEEQRILMFPFLINEAEFDELYDPLFSHVRYVDNNFYNNRYLWDGRTSHNESLQLVREHVLDNDNAECTIYTQINNEKLFVLIDNNLVNPEIVIDFFYRNPYVETLDAIISYSCNFDFNENQIKEIFDIIEKNKIKINLTSETMIKNYNDLLNMNNNFD